MLEFGHTGFSFVNPRNRVAWKVAPPRNPFLLGTEAMMRRLPRPRPTCVRCAVSMRASTAVRDVIAGVAVFHVFLSTNARCVVVPMICFGSWCASAGHNPGVWLCNWFDDSAAAQESGIGHPTLTFMALVTPSFETVRSTSAQLLT